MKRKIVWMFCFAIVVLLMSAGVQAKELREVSASEISKQIEKGGNITLRNASITGKLDLSKLNLETVPNARYAGEIDFYGLEKELKIVESNITIQDSVFEEDVDFSNTVFRKDINFIGTSFSSKNNFNGADFARDANFQFADFAGYANFNGADFAGIAYFRHADFAGYAHFNGADFAGIAYFMDADFARDADFHGADFAGIADFRHADFAGIADFRHADFAGDADFINAVFTGDVDFEGAVFTRGANFRGADFARDADFNGADFAGDARFYSTEFNKVSFKGATFTTISLNESEFNQMKVEWSSLEDALVFDGPTYIKLIKNFREMEQFEDADAAYYQYRQLSQANKKWSSKLINVVAGASCGYGVKPERPLIWAFVLIMVFTLVYWLGDGIRRLKENDGDKNRVSRWAAFYNAFYFSVVTFTTVGYGDWYPEDRYRIVVMIEGVLGWLLLALFIVTLANVMIRP